MADSHLSIHPEQSDVPEVVPTPLPQEFLRTSTGSSIIEPHSVLNESGRTYHGYKEGNYFLPNDPAEQDRLDLQHTMVTLALDGRLHLAPISSTPSHVLDVATGTGIWALEFAEQHPSSHVIGTDLSMIQPDTRFLNCEFIRDDAEDEWVFSHKFDFIHLRMVVTCFNEPKAVLNHAVNNLNPGGWIEYQDVVFTSFSDDESHKGTAGEKWSTLMGQGLKAKGRDPSIATSYKSWLREAGLVDIVEEVFKLPCNGWPDDPKLRRIGQYAFMNGYEGIRGIGWQVLRGVGMMPDEIENLVSRYQQEAADHSIRAYFKMYVVYGRKPLQKESVQCP